MINTQEPERKSTPNAPEDYPPPPGERGVLWIPYKCEGDALRKIQIKPLRETNVGVP